MVHRLPSIRAEVIPELSGLSAIGIVGSPIQIDLETYHDAYYDVVYFDIYNSHWAAILH